MKEEAWIDIQSYLLCELHELVYTKKTFWQCELRLRGFFGRKLVIVYEI